MESFGNEDRNRYGRFGRLVLSEGVVVRNAEACFIDPVHRSDKRSNSEFERGKSVLGLTLAKDVIGLNLREIVEVFGNDRLTRGRARTSDGYR